MARDHATELRQAEAKAAISLIAESNRQQTAEPQENRAADVKQHVKPNPEGVEVKKGKLLAHMSANSQQQVARNMRSQDHPSLNAIGNSMRARSAVNGSAESAGERASEAQLSNASTIQSGQAMSEAAKSATVSPLPQEQASAFGSLDSAAARSPAQSLGEQIRDSMHASLARSERQVVIRLRPPELGSVLVRFQEQNDQIDGVLEVSRSDTRHEVEQALPQVLRGLQDLGVQVRKLEVTVTSQPEGDSDRQQLQQETWSGQQGYGRYANQAQRPDESDWAPGVGELQSGFDDRGTGIAADDVPAGRIDMLA